MQMRQKYDLIDFESRKRMGSLSPPYNFICFTQESFSDSLYSFMKTMGKNILKGEKSRREWNLGIWPHFFTSYFTKGEK